MFDVIKCRKVEKRQFVMDMKVNADILLSTTETQTNFLLDSTDIL